MNKYICIHGHFYQPPRENPWLEEIELQESAYPYHDWNERINAECYAPNASSRILDHEKKIIAILSNYTKMSFNLGPTLLSWMKKHAPEDYQNILKADKESQKNFSGHGSAIAQVYNHMIMPLANSQDKRTQVIWGIKDFEYRFQRKSEGMWLAETAVDIETLEHLAENNILFTILAPYQAQRVRKIGESEWQNVKEGKLDVQIPYRCQLPSGKSIVLFFYDGPIARDTAFSDILKNGESFAKRLLSAFPPAHQDNRLVHIATDGETYGHHHRFGDMALAYCLYYVESNHLAKVTNYGEYLEKFSPAYEVEIRENTSWSCAHGVERWRSDCGCRLGSRSGWKQAWRKPLREALDWLRDMIRVDYEQAMSAFGQDPWKIRNEYIEVILAHHDNYKEEFLKKHVLREMTSQEKTRVLKLLEMQRHAMLMYTSCGWFFDEISGIETLQILSYASRALQLYQELFGKDVEGEFLQKLEGAPSNVPEYQNGAVVYKRFVKPSTVDLLRVGAHYAVTSLFHDFEERKKIYCYSTTEEFHDFHEAGKQKLVVGRVHISSDITLEERVVNYCVLHFGDHNLQGGVIEQVSEEAFQAMLTEIKNAFQRSDTTEVIRLISKYFAMHAYSLRHLFKDEQKNIYEQILKDTIEDLEDRFRHIYEQYYPLLRAREDLKMILPKALVTAIEFILSRDLIELLEKERIDVKQIEKIVEDLKRCSLELDKRMVGFVATRTINKLMSRLAESPQDFELLKTLESLVRILHILPIDLNLWRAQNHFYAINKNFLNGGKEHEQMSFAKQRRDLFQSLGNLLSIRSD